jgi:hypothetical protein
METASAFGIAPRGRTGSRRSLAADPDFDPYHSTHFDRLIETWLLLACAADNLNSSMGRPDLCPFVLSLGDLV